MTEKTTHNNLTRAALLLLAMMLTATTAWTQTTQTVSYIDADGNTQTHEAIVLTGSETSIGLGGTSAETWYVVTGTLNYTSTITLNSDIHLILADGASMTIGTEANRVNYGLKRSDSGIDLYIYGQFAGTGSLTIYATHYSTSQGECIYTSCSTINGGRVQLVSIGMGIDCTYFVMNGGHLDITSTLEGIDANGITINGGQVDVTGDNTGFKTGFYGDIVLGYKYLTDYIKVNSYSVHNNRVLEIASGQAFLTDDATPVQVSGTVTDLSLINGKKLTPDVSAHFSHSGDTYTIHDAAGWGFFCEALQDNDTYNRFSGKTVRLGADIEVSCMAGSDSHDFCGTFDGQGNTLTFNYGTSGAPANEQYVAPFHYVSTVTPDGGSEVPAAFRNLHVAGDIYTSAKYAAGLIARQWGTVNIQNCRSSVVIHSSVPGDGTHSGFVSVQNNGVLNFTGCLFDGKLLTTGETATTNCGGFVGWHNSGTTNISDCLYAPAALEEGETEVGPGVTGQHPSATFGRDAVNSITNSYYTRALGTAQGKLAVTHAAVSAVGEAIATYNVSGISIYSNGMQHGEIFYYDPDRNFLHSVTGYGEGDGGWYLIASPLAGSILATEVPNLITTASEYDLYYFDQTGGDNGKEWKNYKAHHEDATNPFNALVSGQGYLYANAENVNLIFTGTPYDGDGVVNLIYSADNEDPNMWGWNLVGNPFNETAYIDKDSFYRMNYREGNAGGDEIIVATDNAIAPMEGIFVLATEDGEPLTFSTEAPSKGHIQKPEPKQIVLNLSRDGGSVIDRAIVRMGEGQPLPKFQIREGNTKVYIPQDGKNYAIVSIGRDVSRNVSGNDTRDDTRDVSGNVSTTEVPVNFEAKVDDEYTISVSPESVEMGYLHLIDNMTGADVDLLAAGPSAGLGAGYTFSAKTTDYASRFRLVFAVGDVAGGDACEPGFAYVDANGNIVITAADACDASLQVIDAMGRVLVCSDARRASAISTTGMAPGVYVLRLISDDTVRTQKIVIR